MNIEIPFDLIGWITLLITFEILIVAFGLSYEINKAKKEIIEHTNKLNLTKN